jgi:hypothetical protein
MDPAITEAPSVHPNQLKPVGKRRTNYALGGVLVGQGVTLAEAASRTGAKNAESLRRGLARKGVTATSVRQVKREPALVTATMTAHVVSEASAILRDRMNGTLLAQAGKLASKPVGKLASKGQGEAAVLKTMAETWRTLNGNPDQVSISFGVGQLDRFQPDVVQPAIEVESVPAPE